MLRWVHLRLIPLVLVFLLGMTSSEWKWWPAHVYHEAHEAFEAEHMRAEMIRDAEKHQDTSDNASHYGKVSRYDAKQAWNGYTLVSRNSMSPVLIDMKGRVVHRWHIAFSRIWNNAPHVKRPVPNHAVYAVAAHAYPDGSLLMVMHGSGDTPYGYGMVKLDAESRKVWAFPKQMHHDVYVAKNGDIYGLGHQFIKEPIKGLEYLHYPTLADSIYIVSPDGKLKEQIRLFDAIRDTPFEVMLHERVEKVKALGDRSVPYDTTHVNSVAILEKEMAASFPVFSEGDILVSLRSVDRLAVIDANTRKVKWSAKGSWYNQHDAHYDQDGRILFFDNRGPIKYEKRKTSRLLALDPVSQKIVWEYPKHKNQYFFSARKGEVLRLGNGNILINNSEGKRLMEMTPDEKIVWSLKAPRLIPAAVRYQPGYFTEGFCRTIGCKPAGPVPGAAQ